ncbi:unnamed protein product, partial [marine sediment metagenome]
MRLLPMLTVAMLMAVSPVTAQGPPLEFENHEALNLWAGSSPAGGRLYPLGPEELGLFCADRSYTSGITSSEMAVYVQSGDVYKLALYLPLKHFVQRMATIQDETLIIEERSDA